MSMRERFCPNPLAGFTLRTEATFSLGELACDNRSIFYRACPKFVTQFASKINREVCRQMARVSRELKKIATRLSQDSRNALNRSRTGKNPFFNYSSRFLNGFERLSAEAIFRTTAHTAKMKPLLAG